MALKWRNITTMPNEIKLIHSSSVTTLFWYGLWKIQSQKHWVHGGKTLWIVHQSIAGHIGTFVELTYQHVFGRWDKIGEADMRRTSAHTETAHLRRDPHAGMQHCYPLHHCAIFKWHWNKMFQNVSSWNLDNTLSYLGNHLTGHWEAQTSN